MLYFGPRLSTAGDLGWAAAGGLASSPWLRAFPSDVIAAPLFGAALLSVLVPFVAVRLGIRQLWLTALIDVAAFVLYGLLVVLREPVGFGDLVDGLYHGPSQLLTFALPLVSPRSLLVAPVALCWLAGAVAGECVARQWFTVLPYGACLVTFGLAYAGSVRAASGSAHDVQVTAEILLAAGLLGTLAMLRSAQAWLSQDSAARSSQADSVLPLRGLALGTVVTLLVAAGASSAVRTPAFSGRAVAPQRVPSVDQAAPVTPIAFIAALRTQPGKPTQRLFDLSLDATSPAYVSIASLDFYDGDSWSFNRLFRPSGGGSGGSRSRAGSEGPVRLAAVPHPERTPHCRAVDAVHEPAVQGFRRGDQRRPGQRDDRPHQAGARGRQLRRALGRQREDVHPAGGYAVSGDIPSADRHTGAG